MRKDVYDTITSRIVEQLEAGVRPWHRPWNAEHAAGRITRPLRANGIPYRGINVLTLWTDALAKGYAAPVWMTFKQAKELGGHIRKGEHGSLVVYANTITRTETDAESGEETERDISFLKGYTVFNAEQVDGLPERFTRLSAPVLDPVQRIAHADAFFAATGANIHHGGNQAYYTEGEDRIQLPPFEAFRDAESYYATLAHEGIHWTKHPRRLDRDLGRKRWGDEGYAAEELVAELGAAFLCCDLDLTPELREDHAAYLGTWLKVLKGDSRAIFTAAAQAQRAVDFLQGFSAKAEQADAAAHNHSFSLSHFSVGG